jgi:hypothetical protein
MARFALDAHRLTARGEDADALGRWHNGLGKTGDCTDDVLAVVDQNFHCAAAEADGPVALHQTPLRW